MFKTLRLITFDWVLKQIRPLKKLTFGVLFLIFIGVNSYAKTFYIKNSGNDAFNGMSVSDAWQSVAKVNNSIFLPGDSVLFEGGSTFNGNIYFSPSNTGTARNPIFVGSYGTSKAIINAGNSFGFYAYNNEGFEVSNLIFQGSGIVNNTSIGIVFYMDLINNIKLKSIKITGVEAIGFKTSGISISSWPSDNSRSGYQNIVIKNCIVRENGHSGISISGLFSTNDTFYCHKNALIERCLAYNNYGISGHTNHSGSGIVVGQIDSCVIQYCEAYENGKNNTFPNAGPVGIWAWDSKHTIIQYCYAHHNRTQTVDGGGFDLDGGAQNSILQYNYSHDNDGPGLLIAQFTGARKMKNNIVRYNISEKDGKGLGMLIWSGDLAGTITVENIDVYNNTIYIDTIGYIWKNGAFAVYNNFGSMKNIRVCNNIIMAKNGANLLDLNPCINLKFYNNAYFDYGGGFKFKDNMTTYTSLNNWRNATRQEIYDNRNIGFRTNPGLINPGKGGNILGVDSLKTIAAYRLNSNSGLIGKGIFIDTLLGINQVTLDFYGDSINFNKQYSIGAHEIARPKANFTFKDICDSQILDIDNKSENSVSYLWNFGDGKTSILKNPQHLYSAPGIFTITLTIRGKFGYQDSLKKTISIYPKPKADFIVKNICLNDSLSFINTSTNGQSYQWQFGNGDTSNLFNPTLLFSNGGEYTARLIINQQGICFDTIQKKVKVFELPIADFIAKNTCVNDSILITNNSLNIASFKWKMGNGDSSKFKNSFYYKYPIAGSYLIEMTVINDSGCAAVSTKPVTIFEAPKALFTAENNCLGETTTFKNFSSDSSLYSWVFNDLESSNEKNPQFIFPFAKNYSVKLVVTDSIGCVDSFKKSIAVFALPRARFSYQKLGDNIVFRALDTTAENYQWQFNDTLLYGKTTTYKPLKKEDFIAKLFVKNMEQCDSSFEQLVSFNTIDLAQFSINKIKLKAYPNPFQNQVSLNYFLYKNSVVSLSIINVNGKSEIIFDSVIETEGIKNLMLKDDVFCSKGLHLIRLTIDDEHYFLKLIKE